MSASPFLEARGFNAERLASLPHGVRARYVAGCRCQPCRTANTAYEKLRNYKRQTGDWNGQVKAERARRHLLELSAAGVRRRSVRDFSGISDTVLQGVRSGRKQKIRARTERAILAVTPEHALPGARVPAQTTRKRLAWLLSEGFTRKALAIRLGKKSPKLQIGTTPTITAENADRVERVWREFQE